MAMTLEEAKKEVKTFHPRAYIERETRKGVPVGWSICIPDGWADFEIGRGKTIEEAMEKARANNPNRREKWQ